MIMIPPWVEMTALGVIMMAAVVFLFFWGRSMWLFPKEHQQIKERALSTSREEQKG